MIDPENAMEMSRAVFSSWIERRLQILRRNRIMADECGDTETELEEVERVIAILERHIHEEPIDPWMWRKLARLTTPAALRALRHRRDALTNDG